MTQKILLLKASIEANLQNIETDELRAAILII